MAKNDNVSSPYKVFTRPTDWKPLPNLKKPVKKVKKLSKTNSVNA